VRVFAAASLQQAFTAEGKAFEASHPRLRVTFSFAGSQSLVAQVEQGAPADVLATADLATIDRVRDQLRRAPVAFAHNQLALVTEPGNPLHLTSLADLTRPGLKVVLADPAVPVGKAAATALRAAGVQVRPVSLEDAVTGVVTKVRTGEADAGIAYVTDLHDAKVGGLPLAGTTTALGIAPLTGADADAFIAFVRGPAGRRILMSFGFR
jgi:molybdate transport system substrate-binding protein